MTAIVSHSWITFQLVENLIRRSREDSEIKLKKFTVQEATGKAENFCSNIVRVSATYALDSKSHLEQTQNFIVKSSIEVGDFNSLNVEVAYFPKEIAIYDEILPAMEKLLLSIGDKTQIAPRWGLRNGFLRRREQVNNFFFISDASLPVKN